MTDPFLPLYCAVDRRGCEELLIGESDSVCLNVSRAGGVGVQDGGLLSRRNLRGSMRFVKIPTIDKASIVPDTQMMPPRRLLEDPRWLLWIFCQFRPGWCQHKLINFFIRYLDTSKGSILTLPRHVSKKI